MVAILVVAQTKNGSTILEVTFINSNYQLLWLKIVVNGEMQSNHPGVSKCVSLGYLNINSI